jgi:N-methylhydantoinase A
MVLSREAAEKAVQKIAKRFDMTVVDAAYSIIKVANANMCDALRIISVAKGYDPRDFALVAFGGAGPLHAAYLARELEIPKVIVPRYPGVHAAMGCLLVDVRHDLFRTYLTTSKDADLDATEKAFQEMEAEARAILSKEGMTGEQAQTVRYMDLRYIGQWRHLTVEVPKPIKSLSHALEVFHREHEREFSWSNVDQVVEIYGLRVAAIGKVPMPAMGGGQGAARGELRPAETRRVFFERSGGFVETPIYRRAEIPAGATLTGPAIVEQLDATTVIPSGVKAKVDEYLNIIIDVKA